VIHIQCHVLKADNISFSGKNHNLKTTSKFYITMQLDKQRAKSEEYEGLNPAWTQKFSFVAHPTMQNARIELVLWTKTERGDVPLAQNIFNLKRLLSDLIKNAPDSTLRYDLSPANITASTYRDKPVHCCTLRVATNVSIQHRTEDFNPSHSISTVFSPDLEHLLERVQSMSSRSLSTRSIAKVMSKRKTRERTRTGVRPKESKLIIDMSKQIPESQTRSELKPDPERVFSPVNKRSLSLFFPSSKNQVRPMKQNRYWSSKHNQKMQPKVLTIPYYSTESFTPQPRSWLRRSIVGVLVLVFMAVVLIWLESPLLFILKNVDLAHVHNILHHHLNQDSLLYVTTRIQDGIQQTIEMVRPHVPTFAQAYTG